MRGFITAVLLLGLLSSHLFQTPTAAQGPKASAPQSEDVETLLFGKMETPNRHFRFAVELKKQGEEWGGVLKSLDEGNAEFELSSVVYSKDELQFELGRTKAKFAGTADGSGKLQGKWQQRGAELPLTFEVVDEIPAQQLTAVWQGTLTILFQKLDVQFRESADGTVYFDSISQRAGGFLVNAEKDGNKIQFEVPAVQGMFKGEINAEATEISGKWKQSIYSADLLLTKVDQAAEAPAATKPNRPQTPQAPFPYAIKEVTFSGGAEDVTLAGTLTVPDGSDATPVPAVVLVSGSGAQNRDEEIFDHKPFWVIADYFARQGIAVLRYDDRGTAQSTGDFAGSTSADFANDAEAAFAFLRKQAGIDPERVGICGHSEGGLIAPLIAARNDSVAFIVLMAGPSVNGAEISKSQSRLILEASGASEEQLESSVQIQGILVGLAQQKPELSEAEFKQQAKEKISPLLTEENQKNLDVVVASAWTQIGNKWFRYFMQYEPSVSLEKVRCPVLAIFGEKDLQVDPELNMPPMKRALEAAPTEDFKVVVLPDLNHLFQECSTGMLDEYGELEQTIHPSVLELMSTWVLER